MDIIEYAKFKKMFGGSGKDIEEWDGTLTVVDENGEEIAVAVEDRDIES